MTKQQNLKHTDEPEPESSYTLATTCQKLTARCGFSVFIKVLKALRLKQLANDLFGLRGSNRGYDNGDILMTLIMMLSEGGRCLSDVRH